VAEAMAGSRSNRATGVRFAFWGAEEFGLIGSEHYVGALSPRERKDIAVNLNFDMLGSPNYARLRLRRRRLGHPGQGPDRLRGWWRTSSSTTSPRAGWQPSRRRSTGARTTGPFIAAGIPAGGLFTGAEDIKTEREEGIYGGVAGLAYDPCYHAACDTLNEADQPPDVRRIEDAYGERTVVGNVNRQALDEMADGAAHATLAFAPDDLGGRRHREGRRRRRLQAGVQGAVRGALGRRTSATGGGGLRAAPSPGRFVPSARRG
jgi:hypothetical protein